ncbi:TonB-dependent siderophore receptor [Vibrio mediterranei]|uniref:TonB-dependent siderophore receptor n=1 Tax=Vibrio mediterranei TaxID=689 RepID=UPI000D18705C|nr:TonB-dependent siderophore receptor [Vibrio mediterranei]PTC03284.1 TonB-dependent siderophore receptor [Vibrio mediterranei]
MNVCLPSKPYHDLSKTSLAVALALVSAQSLADTAINDENTPLEETVVVWGAKVSSSSESVFAEDMSLRQADHMSDLLRDIPGVDVGGTHSVNQRINIRGFGETDLDIRLDGASQHANMFHHIGNLTLNPDIIKQVDIQVGNNSVTQSGIGGAVYFETKDARDLLRGSDQFGARVFGGYADNNSKQGSLTLYGLMSEKVDYMVYGHGVSRGNFKDGDGNQTYGSEGDVYNILGKLGFEPTHEHRFELAYDYYRDKGDYNPRPDMGGNANIGLTQDDLIPTTYDRNTVTLNYELNKEKHIGRVNAFYSKTKIERDESAISGRWPGNRHSNNSAENRNQGFNAKVQSQLPVFGFDNSLTYGVDYVDKQSKSAYGGVEFMDESAISSAAFIEDKFYATDRFAVTLGGRYDNYKREATTSDKTFSDFTWALAADWEFVDGWTLFASGRTLFKGPELLETFIRYQDVAYLSDDIKPETGYNAQGGLKFNRHISEHFIGGNLTLFNTRIDDYIVAEGSGRPYVYNIYNKGDAQYRGFELSGTYSYQAFRSKASYSKSDNKDLTNGGPVVNAAGRSADIGDSIAVTLEYDIFAVDTLIGWTSIVVLDETNVQDGAPIKQGYNVHNFYAQWVPNQTPELSVTFGIDNIFNEQYVSHASRSGTARGFTLDDYEPGRNIKISAAYEF